MEEADARLQEVVASLLNEHGGNHEQALRQTFACLHNSGLYEANSPADEEQREQQVLAVFRSFPFRAPAAPTGDGGGAGRLVEETQAPPPAYHTLAREPEEAGEVTAAQEDPENVGEDPEALPPVDPIEPHEGDQQAAAGVVAAAAAEATPAGPEFSNQGSSAEAAAAAYPSDLPEQQGAATPESFGSDELEAGGEAAAGGVEAAAAAAAAVLTAPNTAKSGGGVEETKGGEWSGEAGAVELGGFPGSGEILAGGWVSDGPGRAGLTQESGLGAKAGGQEEVEGENGAGVESARGSLSVALNGGSDFASEQSRVLGKSVNDPESTRQDESAIPPPLEPLQANGGGALPAHAAAALVGEATLPGGSKSGMDDPASLAHADGGAAAAAASISTSTVLPAAASAAAAAAPPPPTGVPEPHLKTAGQPLTHANRAQSPTGMATDLQDKLKALKLRRKHRFVTMRIDGTEVVAETAAAPGEGPAQLKAALPYSDCRYAVYDQEIVTADGRKTSKLFFFTWLPQNATPHNKMAYSHGKVTVRQRLEGLYDVAASSFWDVEVALGLVDEDEEDSDIDF